MLQMPIQWSPYRPGPSLPAGEVHVARLPIGAALPVLPVLEKFLTEDELGRASAFHFDRDRGRYAVVRGTLRVILGRYLGVGPGAVEFRSNRFGKPTLAGRSESDGIQFNLSHSGSFAVFAFARGHPVGIDIELVRDDVPYLEMAARFFSTTERLSLQARPAEGQVDFFFDTWTRKEAYVKGRGQGFTIELDRFSVTVDGESPVDDRVCSPTPDSWRTLGIDVAAGYAAALAVEGSDWRVRCFEAIDALEDAAVSGRAEGADPE